MSIKFLHINKAKAPSRLRHWILIESALTLDEAVLTRPGGGGELVTVPAQEGVGGVFGSMGPSVGLRKTDGWVWWHEGKAARR